MPVWKERSGAILRFYKCKQEFGSQMWYLEENPAWKRTESNRASVLIPIARWRFAPHKWTWDQDWKVDMSLASRDFYCSCTCTYCDNVPYKLWTYPDTSHLASCLAAAQVIHGGGLIDVMSLSPCVMEVGAGTYSWWIPKWFGEELRPGLVGDAVQVEAMSYRSAVDFLVFKTFESNRIRNPTGRMFPQKHSVPKTRKQCSETDKNRS